MASSPPSFLSAGVSSVTAQAPALPHPAALPCRPPDSRASCLHRCCFRNGAAVSLPSAFPARLWAGDACGSPSHDTDRRVLSEARLWVSPPPTGSAGRTLTGAFGEVSSPELGSECPHPQRRPAQGGALVTSRPPAPGRKGRQSARTYRGHHRPRLAQPGPGRPHIVRAPRWLWEREAEPTLPSGSWSRQESLTS